MNKDNEKFHNRLKKNKIERQILSVILKACMYTTPIIKSLTKEGRKEIKENNLYELIYSKHGKIGMLDGTIISDSQFVPNFTTNDYTFKSKNAGEYIGVDYLRHSELGENSNPISEGSFYACLLEEIQNNPRDKPTPTHLLNLFDIMHSIQLETPSLETLISGEYLEPINYINALKSVGQYENLAQILDKSEIKNKQVYQVTPKGNGLIFLDSKMGEPKTKKSEQQIPIINRPMGILN